MKNSSDHHRLLRLITKNTVKLIVAGAIIGFFHPYDYWIAGLLAIYLIYSLYGRFKYDQGDKWVYLIGTVITAFLGVICEHWGISNQYWSYHNLDDGRQFPYWLPLAWGLAFTFIYRMEKEIIQIKNIQSTYDKILLALLIAMVFPTLGEIVVINLGAWTYHWPLQLLGVPLLAIVLLMIFHTGVNFLLLVICRRLKINNVVFSYREAR